MAILCRKNTNSTIRIMQSLTIGVSLFLSGSLSFAQVMFTDDFETGDLSKTQNGFKWTSSSWAWVMPFQGGKVLQFKFKGSPPGQDSWAEQRFFLGSYYPDVWIQYDIFVPVGYFQRTGAPANDKAMVHLWTDNYGSPSAIGGGFTSWADGSGSGKLSFNQFQPQNGHIFDPSNSRHIEPGEYGKWVQVTINVRAGTGSSDGLARAWKNGVLVYDHSKASKPGWDFTKFLYEVGKNNQFNNGYLLGWSNSGFDQDTLVYIDNFKFSTTPFIMNFDPPSAPIAQ